MSKIGQIIKKNLLLLFRSKSSAIVILFGPLFLILLIGLAFTNSTTSDLKVGYHAPEETELTTRFVQNMQETGFVIESYASVEECAEMVRQGSIQTCISFPGDFRIANDKENNITFYVDQSRTNFVYQIIDSVTSNLGVETAELSKDLTNSILSVLWKTEEDINDAIASTITLKAATGTLEGVAEDATGKARGMNLTEHEIGTEDLEEQFDELDALWEGLEQEASSLASDARELEDELDAVPYASASLDALKASLGQMDTLLGNQASSRETAIDEFDDALGDLDDAIAEINDQLASAETTREATVTQIGDIKQRAIKLRGDIDKLKASLEGINAHIDTLKVTSSETISNPITTSIEYVSSKNSKLAFMFPYLIMLVVMFVGLLLSGTLIVMEKFSKSAFRTFCTPVSEELLMFGNFLTSFIVVLVQMVIITGIGYYFLGAVLISNLGVSLLILFLGIIFFIILGMSLGYLLSSQEALTMIAISLGSIFLFLSNLILPLETLSPKLQALTTGFNPYVITSEALRKSLLFSAPAQQLTIPFVTLISYSAIMFVIMIAARDILKARLYLRLGGGKRKLLLEDPRDLYLKVGEKEIRDLRELQLWLEKADDATFQRELPWKRLRLWLIRNHHQKWLRVKLAGKTRKQAAAVLARLNEKHK